MVYQVNSLFYPFTNPEIFVKIGLLDSEKQVLEVDHYEIIKKIEMRGKG